MMRSPTPRWPHRLRGHDHASSSWLR